MSPSTRGRHQEPLEGYGGGTVVPMIRLARCAHVRVASACLVLTAWLCGPAPVLAQPAVKRLLYVTQSAGFAHPVLPFSEAVLAQLGATSGAFTVTVMRDVSTLSAAQLATFDAVAFFTSGTLPFTAAQKQALLDFVASGRGFVGLHSATDTFYDWPDYGALVGGYFDGHPWTEPVDIAVEDTSHPAMAGLGARFSIDDEIYQFRAWSRSNVHVLMHLETASVNLGAPGVNRTDNDFALAWTRAHGQGRVFYTALGHRPEVWQDPRFQQHVLGGILWALGPRSRRAADINGDGRGDLLWQADATGQLVAWYMGGAGGTTWLGTEVVTSSAGSEWIVAGTGDFNRDGFSDLLWQHQTTRQLIVWYMRGRTLLRWKWLSQAVLPGWRAAAVADLNRDGHADVVWQHVTTRQVVAWHLAGLDGDARTGFAFLSEAGVLDWSVVGMGDLNRDGVPDLIWQHDVTRQVVAWYLGGVLGTSLMNFAWIATAGPSGWSVVGAGDFDDDLKLDLVWQHDTTRQAVVWYLGGTGGAVLTSFGWLSQVGQPGWRLIVR